MYSWSGFTLTESGGGGLSGGDMPAYNSTLGQFMFGYTQGTVNYSMAVSSALSGTGIQITGIEYGLQYFNQDFSRGTLSATWTLRGQGNNVLQSYYHAFGATTEGWTNFDMTKTFTNPYSLANVGNLEFSITGRDDRFWAGYYGPQVRNQYARLTYGVDQCSTNPLSSPSCAGFSDALAARTTAPAVTEPTTATITVTSPVAATVTTTTSISSTTVAATTTPSASSSNRSGAAAPRLENIIRAVNESTAATVTATVNTSQEQARAQEQAAAQQAESQSQQSQQMSLAAPTTTARVSATSETGTDAAAGSFTRPGDPAAAARGVAPVVTSEPPQESRPQPRNTQPPAELAGGPSVVAFQTAVDITAYTNLALRDSQFYAPREIYRGQQTVDNRQALRGLGTDRLHQQMIDQQWRR